MKKIQNYIVIFLAVLIIGFTLFHNFDANWQKILVWDLIDSDDTIRVLQVRAWLDGQGFYDLNIHRVNPPIGASMHWSRLSDIPLALMQIIMRPFFGNALSESISVFIIPPILGLIYILIIGNFAKKISNSNYSILFAIAFFLFSVSATYNFVPGRVDHHALQLISLAGLIGGFVLKDKKGGIISGLSLASSLIIGFEMLPLQIIALMWLGIFWAIKPIEMRPLTLSFLISFGIGTIIGFFINNAPENYFIGLNDALSIAQVIPILIGSILFGLSAFYIKSAKLWQRFAILVLIAICVLIAILQFPILFKPLYWQIRPIFFDLWLSKNGEIIPMIERPIMDQLAVGLFILLAFFAGLMKISEIIKQKKITNKFDGIESWSLLIIMLVAASIMAFFFQTRVHPHATTIAIFILAASCPHYLSEKSIKIILLGLIIIAPFAKTSIKESAQKSISQTGSEYNFNPVKRCQAIPDFAHLRSQPKGLVAANLSLGALSLITTDHDILASVYHRDMGREILYNIYLSSPQDAMAKLHAHKINYIAFCDKDIELETLVNYSPNSFMAKVLLNNAPNFLEEIPRPKGSDVHLYKVGRALK